MKNKSNLSRYLICARRCIYISGCVFNLQNHEIQKSSDKHHNSCIFTGLQHHNSVHRKCIYLDYVGHELFLY